MQVQKWYYRAYNLASTSLVYQKIGDACQGYGGIKTTGSSTTVTAVDTAVRPFAVLAVGDLIDIFQPMTAVISRAVATKTSDNEITVSGAAITLAGTAAWQFRKVSSGTGASDGWQSFLDAQMGGTPVNLQIDYPTLAATGGLDISIEGKGYEDSPITVVLTKNYASASAAGDTIAIEEHWPFLRVGVKASSDATGTDAITIYGLQNIEQR